MKKLVMWLLVIGGLNWGVYALTGWDVGQLFGDMNNTIAKIIYIIVALAAIAAPFVCKDACKNCEVSTPSQPTQ